MSRGALDRLDRARKSQLTRRAVLLGAAQVGGFALLAGRMYQLQVLESDQYTTLAERNRIGLRLEVPTRGVILDRHGHPLAANRVAYRISVVPEIAGDIDAVLQRLHEIVPLDDAQRERIQEQMSRQRAFVPVTVYDHLSWQEIAQIGVHGPELPGVEISITKRRIYPEGTIGAHIIGYVGAVSKGELNGDPVLGLPDFRIGKSGVEKSYDLSLRGTAGRRKVEVNAIGRTIRELDHVPEQPGAALNLAIDSHLQGFASKAFGDETGAAVVMDADNGEVFALASRPTFDPSLFTDGIGHADWQQLVNALDAPLVNKAIAGQYAPGSTFKMVVALAALESGLVTPKTAFHCSGFLEVGKGRFHCWHRGGHGTVNLHSGLVESCDVYFYEVARRIGIGRIAEMARKLGFGHKLDIDLPGELGGLMPDKEWKKRRYNQPWQIGESLIAGIGQGYVLATPLQLAVMTARLVNGGKMVKPQLKAVSGAEQELPSLGVDPANVDVIVRAMVAVTSEPRGTARASQIPAPGMQMGGKTGTSQVRRITTRERRSGVLRNQERPREHRDHALFVGFAPIERPRFVTAVIVEHGGGGSTAAAPIARDILMETQLRLAKERV
jgi:penicillin-binding protein 2